METPGIQSVIGVRVLHCQRRTRYRTFYIRSSADAVGPDLLALYFLTGGRARVKLKSAAFEAQKGDVLLFDYGMFSELRALPGPPLSYFLMNFYLVSDTGGRLRLQDIGLPPLCRVRRYGEMERLFRRLAMLFRGKKRYWAQECSMTALRILLDLEPQGGPFPRLWEGAAEPPAKTRIMDALNFINVNYKRRLDVRSLAGTAAVHPAHFTRLFKAVTGIPPRRYVLEKKIEKAKDYLLLYNESPATAALDLGFHDYSHFYRVFKRIAGKSPGEFLKEGKRKRDGGRKGV